MAWTFVLDRLGFAAITLPFRTIYIHPGHVGSESLLRHELAHLAQIDRDGAITFWPKILFDYVWYGHTNSPYEIEARAYESD
jgi:hypothetical protein